jgi:hypothetical protein
VDFLEGRTSSANLVTPGAARRVAYRPLAVRCDRRLLGGSLLISGFADFMKGIHKRVLARPNALAK